jgi:hypothetical protein
VPRPEPALVEAALDRVLFDGATRASLLAAAPEALERYDWTTTGRATLDAILEAPE